MTRWFRGQPQPFEVDPDDWRYHGRQLALAAVLGIPAALVVIWVLGQVLSDGEVNRGIVPSVLPWLILGVYVSWYTSWYGRQILDGERRRRELPVRPLPRWLLPAAIAVVAVVAIGPALVAPGIFDRGGLGRGAGFPLAGAVLLGPLLFRATLGARVVDSPRNQARLRAESDRLRWSAPGGSTGRR